MVLIESVTVCQWQRNRSTIAGVLGTLQCSFSALLPLDSWSSYPLLPVNRKMVHLSPSVSGSHFTFKTRSFTCQLLRKITVPFLLTIFLAISLQQTRPNFSFTTTTSAFYQGTLWGAWITPVEAISGQPKRERLVDKLVDC